MPNMGEGSKIVLLVPVTKKDYQKAMALLRNFARNSIEKFDPTSLMLVFLYTPSEWRQYKNSVDIFKNIKLKMKQMRRKYEDNKNILIMWQSFPSKMSKILNNNLLEQAIHKLDKNTIILLGSPRMEIITEYFRRVRQHTVLLKQVYCPIPFTEYHPRIIYSKKVPATLRFQPSLGYFDSLNHQHISFYKYDFDHEMSTAPNGQSLYQVFSTERFHRLVSVEPGLRLRYEEVECGKELRQMELRRCLLRRRRSLGKRSQLAGVVMERGL
jgi:chondroitin polymerizing factor/chondroitin polymerizing factor 2